MLCLFSTHSFLLKPSVLALKLNPMDNRREPRPRGFYQVDQETAPFCSFLNTGGLWLNQSNKTKTKKQKNPKKPTPPNENINVPLLPFFLYCAYLLSAKRHDIESVVSGIKRNLTRVVRHQDKPGCSGLGRQEPSGGFCFPPERHRLPR